MRAVSFQLSAISYQKKFSVVAKVWPQRVTEILEGHRDEFAELEEPVLVYLEKFKYKLIADS